MKYKKISFSTLEKIEKKKLEKEIINIKNIYLNKKQNDKQLKLLIDYQQEYIKKINDKTILGVSLHEWKNYNDFIFILQKIIRNNINIIKKNQNLIQERLKKWSDHRLQLKIWKYLRKIDEKKTLRIKKIKEQILNDNYAQLKILKRDNY